MPMHVGHNNAPRMRDAGNLIDATEASRPSSPIVAFIPDSRNIRISMVLDFTGSGNVTPLVKLYTYHEAFYFAQAYFAELPASCQQLAFHIYNELVHRCSYSRNDQQAR